VEEENPGDVVPGVIDNELNELSVEIATVRVAIPEVLERVMPFNELVTTTWYLF
jgi:hypothetical protein